MKFLVLTLISNGPDPRTGRTPSPHERFRRVVEHAVLAEELGFDGFGSASGTSGRSSPRRRRWSSATSPRARAGSACSPASRRCRLLDPVRAFEDYATLDHLSDGRLELIIGKGNGAAQKELFHVTTEDQWDRNREGYELFRRLWREDKVTWEGRFRPSLHEAETWPRPLQQPIRVWHGSATSQDSVELAARYGDPLFSANVTNPIEPYAELVALLPGTVGGPRSRPGGRAGRGGHRGLLRRADLAGGLSTRTGRSSSNALQLFERGSGCPPVFPTLEDVVERSSASSAARSRSSTRCSATTRGLGHEVLHLHADGDGLTTSSTGRRWSCSSPTSPRVLRGGDPQQAAGRPDPVHGAAIDPEPQPVGAR